MQDAFGRDPLRSAGRHHAREPARGLCRRTRWHDPRHRPMTQHPEIFWGVVASMLIGNVVLLILNLNRISLWVRVLQVRYDVLIPAIFALSIAGALGAQYVMAGVWWVIPLAVAGYFLRRAGMALVLPAAGPHPRTPRGEAPARGPLPQWGRRESPLHLIAAHRGRLALRPDLAACATRPAPHAPARRDRPAMVSVSHGEED